MPPLPFEKQAQRVVASLAGHKGRVNCVRWLPDHPCGGAQHGEPQQQQQEQQLVQAEKGAASTGCAGGPPSFLASGSCDRTIRLWAVHGPRGGTPRVELLATLQVPVLGDLKLKLATLGVHSWAQSRSQKSHRPEPAAHHRLGVVSGQCT